MNLQHVLKQSGARQGVDTHILEARHAFGEGVAGRMDA